MHPWFKMQEATDFTNITDWAFAGASGIYA
jgi:hypothetical protein